MEGRCLYITSPPLHNPSRFQSLGWTGIKQNVFLGWETGSELSAGKVSLKYNSPLASILREP